jgi:hypothetical protein
MKLAATGILFLCLWSSLVWSREDAMKFTRPTVIGLVLERAPERYHQYYKDQYYQFVVADNSEEPVVSTFVAHDLVKERWLQITKLSTEHARLGKSNDRLPEATPDFYALRNDEYVQLPFKSRGWNVFPDRIVFDSTNRLYRMSCNASYNLPIDVTTFLVLKSDLDAIN